MVRSHGGQVKVAKLTFTSIPTSTQLRPNSDLPLVGFDTRKLPSGSGALTHLHILVHCVPHLNALGFYHFGAEQRSQEQAGPSNSLK
jgi:hypothetical protein